MDDMISKLKECLRAASKNSDDMFVVIEEAIEAALLTTPDGDMDSEQFKLKRTRLKYTTIARSMRGEETDPMQIIAALSKSEQKLTYPMQTMYLEIIEMNNS